MGEKEEKGKMGVVYSITESLKGDNSSMVLLQSSNQRTGLSRLPLMTYNIIF